MELETLSIHQDPKRAFSDSTISLMEILKEYSDLYTETPKSIYKYFELLVIDQKPAVSIEIYNKPLERIEEFRKKLECYFFVFGNYRNRGTYDSYHLSVSKVKSIASCIDTLERDGFAGSAGAIGLLLGFEFHDVVNYIKKTNEDSLIDSK